jgi:hypothetical protein
MEKEFKIKEMKIEVPSGMEIDKENSTFECIKFKPIKKKLPKTWEEFCKTSKRKPQEAWIEYDSEIQVVGKDGCFTKNCVEDRNLLPNRQYAEAIRALCQLIQLRDCYNDGWIPDWNTIEDKYCIEVAQNEITRYAYKTTSRILAFKSDKLRDEFLNNFIDLLEVAKPLL